MTEPVRTFQVTFPSPSPEATMAFGRELGAVLDARPAESGAILLLTGELGSGKTAFVQGLAEGLGAGTRPKSPTFALQLSYRLRRGELNHLDLYRLQGNLDQEELGLVDMFAGPDVIALEWAERLGPGAPADALRVDFVVTGPEARLLHLSGPERPWQGWVAAALSAHAEGHRAHAGH